MARTVGRRRVAITIPAGGAAQPISSTNRFTTDFEIHFPSANAAANGFVGDSTVTTSWIPRAKGQTFNFVHGTGTMAGQNPVLGFNLAKIFVLANVGDTCIVEWMDFDDL